MTQEKRSEEKNRFQGRNKSVEDKSPLKEKRESPPSKVVIRRLPPTLTEETFLEQISPVPENDYFYFCKGDRSLGPNAFSRAYINFKKQEDMYTFRETFDDYVFVDGKGNEYAAIVEFAPFQKVPKKKEKKDNRKGTIEEDSDYKSFLEKLENPETEVAMAPEKYLEEIEQREKELKANKGVLKMSTPLLDYIKKRKEEKRAALQRAKDERKRRDFEKKKAKEDERRKKREDDRKRQHNKDKDRKDRGDKDRSSESKEDTHIKLLKNPEREKDSKENAKDRSNARNYGKEKSPIKDGSAKYGKDRDRQRDRGGNRDDRKEDERVPSYARKDDKGERKDSGRQGDRGRDGPRDRGKDRDQDRRRGGGGGGGGRDRDRDRDRERERNRDRERDRNSDKNREKEKKDQTDRDKGKDQSKDSGAKPKDQPPPGRFAKNKDGTRGSPKDQEDSKGANQSDKKEIGNEGGRDKRSPIKEGDKGKKEYKLRFSKEERRKRSTPEDRGDKNSADSDKDDGSAGGDAESAKARERRKMRYKDRPERAIYQPGQRAAQRRKDMEKKSSSQDGKGDEKPEEQNDKEETTS